MPPQDPLAPPTPPSAPEPPSPDLPPVESLPHVHNEKDTILAAPDSKKNPYNEHIARPKEVPLARPEFDHSEQATPIVPDPTTATQQAYAFIESEPKVRKQPLGLTNSLPKRIAVVGVGLVLLFTLLAAGNSLLHPKPKVGEVVASVQRQQEILHVLSGALEQTSLSSGNRTFTMTALLALSTSQHRLITYLQGTGQTLTPEILNLKVSTSVDSDLAAATANNAFNASFKTTMEDQLTAYASGIKIAYTQAGDNGKAILSDDYRQAQLLLVQLQTVAN